MLHVFLHVFPSFYDLYRFWVCFKEVVKDVSGLETGSRAILINSLEKAKYTDQYSFCLKAMGRTVFKICLLLMSLYYIVFANILITLMRKIGKKWSWICNFANILLKFYASRFTISLFWRILSSNLAKVFLVSLEVSVNLPVGLICIFA